MCQYCEGGKRKKPLDYKSYGNNYSYTDSFLFKINIGNNTLMWSEKTLFFRLKKINTMDKETALQHLPMHIK